MRRLFIIRKDLHLSTGKAMAMISHCNEAYWTNMLKAGNITDNEFETLSCVQEYPDGTKGPCLYLHPDIMKMSQEAFDRGQTKFTRTRMNPRKTFSITVEIDKEVWNNYINDIFTKTICEAKNLNKLLKAKEMALELGLVEGKDFGFINDKCLTELTPENEDGTCTVGIWFKPLPDDVAHTISKKYPLYKD